MRPNGGQMVERGDAQGLTLDADSVSTIPGTPAHPPAGAPSSPIQLPLAAQLEMLILGVGLIAFPVLQLHTQRVGRPAGQLMDHLVAQPVLSSWVTKALWRRGE